jgi:protein phosphatase
VLYQGLAQDLGPISLSQPLEVTDIEIEDLPEITRQQVESTISAGDRESADQIIDRLEQAAAANRPPTAVSPEPSDAGGVSDAGGAEEESAEDMAPLPTATPPDPDDGEAT